MLVAMIVLRDVWHAYLERRSMHMSQPVHMQSGDKDSTDLARCEAKEVGARLLGCYDANATANVCLSIAH